MDRFIESFASEEVPGVIPRNDLNQTAGAVETTINQMKLQYIDLLFSLKRTPSLILATMYDMWKTRTVRTSTGTFTVPSGVYYLGIACCGKGGNGGSGSGQRGGGGGGGLALKVKKVTPGDVISYSISSGISTCDGMTANPGSDSVSSVGGAGGSASGGDYNYTGGSGGSGGGGGGGGLGGGNGGNAFSSTQHGPGGAGFSRLMWNEWLGSANGGSYSDSENSYGACGGGAGGNGGNPTIAERRSFGGALGANAVSQPFGFLPSGRISAINFCSMQLGFIVTSDLTGAIDIINLPSIPTGSISASILPTTCFGLGGRSAGFSGSSYYSAGSGNFGGGGGGGVDDPTYRFGQSGGFGGGGGGSINNSTFTTGGGGGFGGGGGGTTYGLGGSGGFGGGAAGQGLGGGPGGTPQGGAAVVVFIY